MNRYRTVLNFLSTFGVMAFLASPSPVLADPQIEYAYPAYKIVSVDGPHHRVEATSTAGPKERMSILIDGHTTVLHVTSMNSLGYGDAQQVPWRSLHVGTTIYVDGVKTGNSVRAKGIYF